MTGGEAQVVGFGQRVAIQIGQQQIGCGILVHMRGRIDVPVADAVLQGDAPLPASGAGGRARQRLVLARKRAGDGNGAVARQPFRPVIERYLQRLPQQQRAKAGAIEEKLALDDALVLQPDAGDEAAVCVLHNLDHLAFLPQDTLLLGSLTKEPGVAAGIELEGVGQLGKRRFGIA